MRSAGMRSGAGFSMIEVLITIAILMVGLLGLAALQTKTSMAELEAYQRSQALMLIQDLADRVAVNKAAAASYVGDDVGLSTQSCAAMTGAQLDLCEWGNQLAGAAEVKTGGRLVGSMIGARGCVVLTAVNVYMITVAWQGLTLAGTPAAACGSGAYGDDRQRRTVSTIIRVGTLGT